MPSGVAELTALTKLDAFGCEALQALPQHFGQLNALQDLDVSHCGSLQQLPDSIGEKHTSRDANPPVPASETVEMRCHSCTGGCGSLTSLAAGFCRLTQLPDSLGTLTNLASLDLQWCEALERLPASIGQLQKLWRLQVQSHLKPACSRTGNGQRSRL